MTACAWVVCDATVEQSAGGTEIRPPPQPADDLARTRRLELDPEQPRERHDRQKLVEGLAHAAHLRAPNSCAAWSAVSPERCRVTIVGLVFVGVAGYVGFATLLEDSARRMILPIGRRGPAKTAFAEGLAAQLAELEHEAGVREQL